MKKSNLKKIEKECLEYNENCNKIIDKMLNDNISTDIIKKELKKLHNELLNKCREYTKA